MIIVSFKHYFSKLVVFFLTTMTLAEGTHTSMVVHHLYGILGVSDHKGQMLLLLVAMVMYSLQCHVRKNLAAEVGGAKRLHALTTVVVAMLLCPWSIYQWLTSEVTNLGVAEGD